MISKFKKKLRVLIVENNPVDKKVLSSMLTKSPYGSFAPEFADSFTLACEALLKKRFDVVILDLNLPDARGLETLKKMHKNFPDVAIVVNTGVYQDALGLRAVAQGAQDYLLKGKYDPYTFSKSLYYAVERKKVEKELKTAYNHLQEMQTQLIQAEKMNVIGAIASGVAHEVKNPLATILYGVEFLNTKYPNKDNKVVITLQSITEAAQKANEIIKDLLDFAGLSNFQKNPEDITEVINDALKLTKHQCNKKNIKVSNIFDDTLPQIKIDKNRIEQVIVDLILNSIHALPGGGKLCIRVHKLKYSRRIRKLNLTEKILRIGDTALIIDIEDNGPGIAEENLSKIFDPFFTTRRAAGGVGLGLSIARTIMHNHNGEISIENMPEGGTRARLLLKV